ncbi:helix-hairpin-helix domain-containing protein [candidate division KSB1 bacterium]
MKNLKNEILADLQKIPGVGKSISLDLFDLGIRKISDLKNNDPQKLYDRLCFMTGSPVDRCVLYVFRCAVYFASEKEHDPELLKWWNWKDKQAE